MFETLPSFDVTLIGSTMPNLERIGNLREAEVKEALPSIVSNFLTRKPYSTASFIELVNLENHLGDADVIVCFELFSFISRQCSKLAKRKGKKLVVCCFGSFPAIPLYRLPPYSWNVDEVIRQADLFIAFTHRTANFLQSLKIAKEKIEVVYPGIDVRRFSPSTTKKSGEVLRVLFVGGYIREKGLSVLLPAFSRLCRDFGNIELWICTSDEKGEEEPIARAYKNRYPVKILGNVKYSKIDEVYKQCDVFCHPSYDRRRWGMKIWEEEFGFSLVEAMACGLPVIATDCGAMYEIVGPRNLIVPQKSVGELYLALKRVLEDEDYRERIGKENRSRALQNFDLNCQRLKMNEVLKMVVEGTSQR
ncbi:MAG: glycosyltransferase family 4 protein [Candidatus Geothermarchaeales archaeon]